MGVKIDTFENGVLVKSVDTRTLEDRQKEAVRQREYGTAEEQLEYAIENGWDALVSRNLQIKADNPKPTE